MIPEEVFKRRPRHNNTPESTLLIIANFIVVSAGIALFIHKNQVNWFFWIVIVLLSVYNFFTIRRHKHEFTKTVTIAFSLSVVVLIIVFFVFKSLS